ncbi:hypothetical protein GQ457_15G005250 [Hibiscus cannabinus]
MSFQDPWYRYPTEGIDTQGTDTLLCYFQQTDSRDQIEYRYSRRVSIPLARYRYPKAGYRYPSATVFNGHLQRLVFQRGYRYPKPLYRYPLSQTA